MEEKLILVDIFDHPYGSGEKLRVHREGLLHRAFSVFLYDGSRMFVQRRALHKYHSGGLWANACCSHPREGEALETAVQRRMQEELGIQTPVTEIFSFVYREVYENGLSEYEYDHVFLGRYRGEIRINEEEASEGIWVGIDELAKRLCTHPADYAAWFLIAAPRVLELIRQQNK